jgi:hypothetical protein
MSPAAAMTRSFGPALSEDDEPLEHDAPNVATNSTETARPPARIAGGSLSMTALEPFASGSAELYRRCPRFFGHLEVVAEPHASRPIAAFAAFGTQALSIR